MMTQNEISLVDSSLEVTEQCVIDYDCIRALTLGTWVPKSFHVFLSMHIDIPVDATVGISDMT